MFFNLLSHLKNLNVMNVYLVLAKRFIESNGKEYQIADALSPITVVSNYKKAESAMKEFENYFKKKGFERTTNYNYLFPVDHFTMKNDEYKMRVVIYTLKEEVE